MHCTMFTVDMYRTHVPFIIVHRWVLFVILRLFELFVWVRSTLGAFTFLDFSHISEFYVATAATLPLSKCTVVVSKRSTHISLFTSNRHLMALLSLLVCFVVIRSGPIFLVNCISIHLTSFAPHHTFVHRSHTHTKDSASWHRAKKKNQSAHSFEQNEWDLFNEMKH